MNDIIYSCKKCALAKVLNFYINGTLETKQLITVLHLFICCLFIYLKLVWIVFINQKVNFYDNQL